MNKVYESLKGNVNIICADDHEDTLALMKFKCEQVGWHGVYVNTALGIIDAINNSREDFDAIIADINFNTAEGPDVTGITVARTIRKVRPDVPIMFVSAYVNTITREEIRRVNAEVMTKPVDFDALFDQIASMIYWHRHTTPAEYIGKDRRKSSINRGGWARRKTDCHITPSKTVIDILSVGAKHGDG